MSLTSSVHRLFFPTWHEGSKIFKKWPTKGGTMGKGIPMEHLGPLYTIHDQSIKFIWPNKKTKTQHVSLGANSWNPYMKAIWRSIPNRSQLTVGIFGSTNSHTSRGVKNYPAIPQYNILRILYNIQHHSNHDLPINKTRTQFRKFSHFLTTPTYKSAPIFDHISPKSCKQATHHLFLGNQNAHVKYDVKNLHLPSDEKP